MALLMDYGLPSCVRDVEDSSVRKQFEAPELWNDSYDSEGSETSESDAYDSYEVLETNESDVYAMGMTFYEVQTYFLFTMTSWKRILSNVPQILTEHLPFQNLSLNKSEFENEVGKNGLRPTYPGLIAEQRGLSMTLWDVMCRCWSTNVEQRPSAELAICLIENMGYQSWRRQPENEIDVFLRSVCDSDSNYDSD